MRTYLLSIKKEHFEALLDGRKKHEFRRRFPKIEEDFMVIFYFTSPIKIIGGYCIFGPVIRGSIQKMVRLVSAHRYSSKERITDYFHDLEEGNALPAKSVKRINRPINLIKLTKLIPGFRPPQSYINLDNLKYDIIKKMVIKNES